ncbi:MAG: MATE family efflux transporter, partial [Chloroflexota bacterium]
GANWFASLLGASGAVQTFAVSYMQIRLYGAPAVLITLVAFGALRGLQDMRSPLWIAVGINLVNLVLDWLLIFGNAGFPEMGVAGSALASTISQWLGALAAVIIIARKLGLSSDFDFSDVKKLLRVGRDLFMRTALLNFFLAFTTRAANNIGADAGAAHQVIRQVYSFTGLTLDAFALTVQSLVGYFMGQASIQWAKKVARVGFNWSVVTGVLLGAGMWLGRGTLITYLVPASAVAVFLPAWGISALSQPLNAISFLTDGVHWGTGDYRFLRNAMLTATGIGIAGIWLVGNSEANALNLIWAVTAVWVLARGILGVLRIWPGIGKSVFSTRKIT